MARGVVVDPEELRVIWLRAAWRLLVRGRFRDAHEAWVNAGALVPPWHWSTGVPVARWWD